MKRYAIHVVRTTFLIAFTSLISVGYATCQDFTDGNYFFSNDAEIDEYDLDGNFVGSIVPDLAGSAMRGITFGPDGLLYAVVPTSGFATVVSMDHSGNIQDSYNFTSFTGSNISYGKIEFGTDNKFYVTSGVGVVEFTLGDLTSGNLLYNSDTFALDVMPNGNLLLANNYGIQEIDPDGNWIRDINLSDPYNTYQGPVGFWSMRGIEYDPNDNVIFATQLGFSGFSFRLMKLEADTGNLLDNEYFWYGDQIFLDSNDKLVVGSRTQSPGLFEKDLGFIGPLGDVGLFVTQYIPEPVLGDANDDGELNNLDIASFVLALTNLPAYQTIFPKVDPDVQLDMDGSGVFNNLDIAGFVAELAGG